MKLYKDMTYAEQKIEDTRARILENLTQTEEEKLQEHWMENEAEGQTKDQCESAFENWLEYADLETLQKITGKSGEECSECGKDLMKMDHDEDCIEGHLSRKATDDDNRIQQALEEKE